MTAPNFNGIVLTDEGVERLPVVVHPEVADSLDEIRDGSRPKGEPEDDE